MKRTCYERRSNTVSERLFRLAAGGTTLALLLLTAAPASADTTAQWTKECAKCHAADGSGQTPIGKLLGLRDYRDATVRASFDRANMIDATTNGVKNDKGKEVMKGFGSKFEAAEIEALVDFVLALSGDGGAEDDSAKEDGAKDDAGSDE